MPLDYSKLMNWPQPEAAQTYTARDSMLYALSVAAATSNPVPPHDLQFVYEQGLKALPSMAVILAGGGFWMADPETGIDITRMLHGEQFLALHKPLPAAAELVGRGRVDEIYDKGADKGAVMYLSRELYEKGTGDLVATVGMSLFLRGNGGFGGKSEGQPKPHPLPQGRAPDLSLDLPTRPELAVLYYLVADPNPLHVDEKIARRAGFDKPILQGLCSYGIACRALIQLVCGNDPARLRRLDVRFASPVYPGETLRTEVWLEGPGRAAFQVRVVERDLIVLTSGRADSSE